MSMYEVIKISKIKHLAYIDKCKNTAYNIII